MSWQRLHHYRGQLRRMQRDERRSIKGRWDCRQLAFQKGLWDALTDLTEFLSTLASISHRWCPSIDKRTWCEIFDIMNHYTAWTLNVNSVCGVFWGGVLELISVSQLVIKSIKVFKNQPHLHFDFKKPQKIFILFWTFALWNYCDQISTSLLCSLFLFTSTRSWGGGFPCCLAINGL